MCTCKRNVVGRECNQCAPQFYGLGVEEEGCKACDCDDGGAFDNNCDHLTGQVWTRVFSRHTIHPLTTLIILFELPLISLISAISASAARA